MDRSTAKGELARPTGGSSRRVLENPAHREARLVFLLAQPAAPDIPLDMLGPDVDWSRLLQIAWDENAVGALRDYCRRLPSGVVPLEVERRLACLALERDFRMRMLQERLRESLAALESAGIEVMLLKGAALVATVYGSFAARAMNDVDLLVHPDRADEAQALMHRVGWEPDPSVPDHAAYTTHHHLPPLRDARGTGLRVEIHRGLLPTGHPFRFTLQEVWSEARPVRASEHRTLVPQPNHHALHLAIHFAWSHMMRVGAWHAFRDIGALDRAGLIDWSELAQLAIRTGASSCCYWMLRLGRAVANLPVPDAILEQLRPPYGVGVLNRIERHLVHILYRRDASHLSVRLERTLWNLAIGPRALGHGDTRPWLVSTELATARREQDTSAPAGWVTRHAAKVRLCGGYLASLIWF